jgi:putative Holliday junction resolvase
VTPCPCTWGIDHGARRVGIAVSDPDAAFAFALETHVEGRDGSVLARLAELVRERDVAAVIVGLPLTADGREGESAVRARRFAERLAQDLSVPRRTVGRALHEPGGRPLPAAAPRARQG